MRVIDSLNTALHELMAADPSLHVMGEDILDPYGGAFKVTAGLSSRFPQRVLTTPISEAALTGFAIGMALRGKPVIAEIMFGDFLSLCMDQLLNHASKLAWSYGGARGVPLVMRTPMGGRRGYGPTHSQSLEKHFCGIPGLTVLAVHQYDDPGALLRQAHAAGGPCLLIENKSLYARQVEPPPPPPADPDVLIVTYGGSVELAYKAARALVDEEVAVEVLALTQLSPFPDGEVAAAARRCRRVLAVEEGSDGWGFAAQVARAVVNLDVRLAHLAGPAHPLPASRPWELAVLPDESRIAAAAIDLLLA